MKRYLVFAGDNYYPNGGWDDFQAEFDSIEQTTSYVEQYASKVDWHQIVDTTTGERLDAEAKRLAEAWEKVNK